MPKLILILTKILTFLFRKFHKNSDLPGIIALRFQPDIFNFFNIQSKTIFITGSNGKAAIANNLSQIYQKEKHKVHTNAFSSNNTLGILTCLIDSSNLFGTIKNSILILKIDPFSIEKTFKNITPDYLIVTNLSREQSMAVGDFTEIFNTINKNIKPKTTLILNADDPLVYKFSLDLENKIHYYGVNNNFHNLSSNIAYDDNLDFIYCPICYTKLVYDKRFYDNIGHYHCINNHYTRPNIKYEAKIINENNFTIDNHQITITEPFLYHVYSATATYVMGVIDNLNQETITYYLNTLTNKSVVTYKRKEQFFYFSPTKTNNPASFLHMLNYINQQKQTISIVIGFKKISNEYIENDTSWLWDVKFELINKPNTKNIYCLEKYAYDIAVRLKYAGLHKDKIIIIKNPNDLKKQLSKEPSKHIYFLVCDDLKKKYQKEARLIK